MAHLSFYVCVCVCMMLYVSVSVSLILRLEIAIIIHLLIFKLIFGECGVSDSQKKANRHAKMRQKKKKQN